MTIWLLGLLLMASGAGLGYRQGALRVAISFIAILVGALLAPPLGHLLRPLIISCGLNNPPLPWLLGPVAAFLLISILFKVGAFYAHQQVDVHFKYHAGELRFALWERLNRRVGLCLGLLNGAAYFIIISFMVYTTSYWTVQIASSETDPRTMRILNTLGQDLQSSGFVKVAGAVDGMPELWYDSADLAGLIYSNPMSEAALSRYPAFLTLAEKQEFKDLGSDGNFGELRLKKAPFMDIVNYPRINGLVQNPEFLKMVWDIVVPDMKDLCVYLETGHSPKYDPEKILGRWKLDVTGVITAFRRAKPNMTAKEMVTVRRVIGAAFERTSFVAMTGGRAILKNSPPLQFNPAGMMNVQTVEGQWKNLDGKYQISVTLGGLPTELTASVEGDRLTVNNNGASFAFNRED